MNSANFKRILSRQFDGSNLMKYTRFIFPILLIAIITIMRPSFFTISNGINVLRQASILFILAAGQTLVILTEGIDLSVGSIVGLTACLAGGIIIKDGNNLGGIAVALLVGVIVGLLNGLMISYVRVPAFISTYGMMMLARGLTNAYMKGEVFWGFNETFRILGAGSLGPIPVPIIIGSLVYLVFFGLLKYSTFGRSVYHVGNNRNAAFVSGFKVNKIIVTVYIIEGLIGALGGLIYLSRLNSAEASLGTGFQLDAIGAVVIGGTSFYAADGNITNAVIGAITLTLLRNAMNIIGISSYWQPFVIGFLIVAIVAVERFSKETQLKVSLREKTKEITKEVNGRNLIRD